MKRTFCLLTFVILCICLFGCADRQDHAQIAATTLPVYEFTARLCDGTDIEVVRLVTESVSCLHDYTLQTAQMRTIENAQLVVMSGAGLEDFLDSALNHATKTIDASAGIELVCHSETHEHDVHHDHEHAHTNDPHIWLSPASAELMANNICTGLMAAYPEHEDVFSSNLAQLTADLEALSRYAKEQLQTLSCRQIITFHDGFSYMADAFDLHIVHAMEEESGSEASAAELIDLIQIVSTHSLDAIFTERNGSDAAAEIIAAETGAQIYKLDMAMSGESYFYAMYYNIDILKEALS